MNVRLSRLLTIELTIIATGVIAYFAAHLVASLGHIFLIFAFAILLTYALLPLVNWLDRRRWIHRGIAVTIVYIVMLAVLGGLVALVSVPLAKQGQQLARDYPSYSQKVRDAAPNLERDLRDRGINIDVTRLTDDATESIKEESTHIASQSGELIADFFGTVSDIIIVLFVSIYFLYSGHHFIDAVVRFFPPRRQRLVRKLAAEYDQILGGFVGGSLLIGLIIAVVVSIFLAAVGLPYWIVAGIVAGVTSLIPVVGPFLGVVVPVIIAAFVNPVLIPVFLVFFVILNELAHKLLYPRVVGDAVRLHALVVFFGILIGASLAGIAGALLATPILALFKVTFEGLQKTTGYRTVKE